jgi:hypothetical protein
LPTTGANAGYGNFTALTGMYLMDQIQFVCFSGSHTLNIGKYGLIIIKWCFETAEQVVSGSSSSAN